MGRGTDILEKVVTVDSALEKVRQAFEPRLAAIGLSKEQIEGQTKEDLEQSLETVNDAIAHPDSFGTFKVEMVTTLGAVITTSANKAHIEIGILPLLLERKKLIMDCLRTLTSEEQIKNLHDLAQGVSEGDIRRDLENQIEAIRADIQKRQEQADELDKIQRQEEVSVRLGITRLQAQAEIDERKAKVRSEMIQSFLARETVASVMGGLLLILISIALLTAMFFKITAPDIINNSFLIILGYFFGQATGKVLTPAKGSKGDQQKE